MQVIAKCPKCGKEYKLDASQKGKRAKCAACGESFTISITAPPRSGNLLTRFWTSSPPAFRNSFLATFGVISALLVAYYVFGITGWLRRPAPNPVAIASQSPTPARTGSTLSKGKVDLDYVAAVITLQGKLSAFLTVNEFFNAAKALDFDANSYTITMLPAEQVLKLLYTTTENYNIPDHPELIRARSAILHAINTKHAIIQALFAGHGKYDMPAAVAGLNESHRLAAEATDKAVYLITGLYSTIDPDLIFSMGRVANVQP